MSWWSGGDGNCLRSWESKVMADRVCSAEDCNIFVLV